MGGKTSQSTSQVSIPPEVLARYNSVNATAENVAQTPFQQYSTNPSAFVQPLTPTQQAGIQNTNAAQGMAQPYYNAATGFALAGAQPINAQPLNTQAYMNPYLNTVLGSTEAMVNQQNQQAMSGQTGNAMSQGYFGGDRAGIAAAVLAGQQQLTGGQLYSGIASDAYNQAIQAAQQQQGVNLGAAQANRAALTGAGEQLAGLGTTAQGTALQGAQAQLGAGQVEQQTGQAGLTALYNQFLQQQSYPFQVAQFLANIAEGTGALSGSTTTQTQPQSIFSDERLKEDMVPVGVGFDGANIYRFRYRGDPTTHVGFSAQETARLHPEAVSVHPSGFLMVDYDRATREAAGFAMAANDNYGDEPEARRARAAGGRAGFDAGGMAEWGSYPSGTNPMVIAQILQAQQQMYGPYSQAGLYGGQGASGGPYGGVQGHVPSANLPVGQLMVSHPQAPQQGGLGSAIHDVAGLADDAEGLKSDYHLGHEALDFFTGHHGSSGGGGDGGDDVNKYQANGGRIGRAPGGMTSADYAKQAAMYAARARIHAQAAAARRDILQRQAADASTQGQIRNAVTGGNPIMGAGYDFGASIAPSVNRYLGNVADTLSGGNLNWVDHPMWGPGQQGAEAGLGAGRAAGAAMPAAVRAAAIQHHHQQAAAHADVAQQLAAGASGRESPDLVLNTGREQPTANVQPINVGDVSHLQTGFAPANLQAYHPGPFHQIGDWLAGHFGSDAQRMAYDARGMTPANSVQPIQSAAFQHPSNDQGLTHDQWLAGVQPQSTSAAAPPALAAAAPTSTEPIRSEAFQDPARHPQALDAGIDPGVQLAARGGFARADGGAAKNPSFAVVSGSPNLTSRVARQGGGPSDLSNPQNDDPYAVHGPGLNIPTAETQHPKLATAAPPSQSGQGGLGSAIGMGSDLVNIAKFALPFFGVPLAAGGRAGYDDGGPVPDPNDPNAPPAPKPATNKAAGPPPLAAPDAAPAPAPQPGFGGAAQPPPEDQGGGHGGFLGSLFHGVESLGKGVAGMAGYEGGGHWDRDRLMPLLSAIGAAGSVPTVHPFVALAAGLGGYGKAYMQQQQAEQGLNLTQAQANLAQYNATPAMIRDMAGYVPGPVMTPDGRAIDTTRSKKLASGQWVHLATADEMLGMGGGPAAPGLATPQTIQAGHGGAGAPAAPVQADYSGGGQPRYTLGPSDQEVTRAQHLYGVDPDASGIQNRIRRQMGNVQVTDQQIADAGKRADDFAGSLQDASSTQRALLDSVQQIEKLPETGPGAVGPGQEERQLALSSYNMMMRMFGLAGDPSIDQNTETTQILQKLSALQGAASAGQYGQHAATIAQQLSGVMPSGHMQKPAAYNLLSQMLVTNQQARDFANYRAQYQRLGLGDFQALEAFHRDFDPMYAKEGKQLQGLMARGPKGGPSVFEVLQQRPQDIQRLEQGWTDASGTKHPGLGYLGRYLQ